MREAGEHVLFFVLLIVAMCLGLIGAAGGVVGIVPVLLLYLGRSVLYQGRGWRYGLEDTHDFFLSGIKIPFVGVAGLIFIGLVLLIKTPIYWRRGETIRDLVNEYEEELTMCFVAAVVPALFVLMAVSIHLIEPVRSLVRKGAIHV